VLLYDYCTERDIFVSQFLPLIRTRSYHIMLFQYAQNSTDYALNYSQICLSCSNYAHYLWKEQTCMFIIFINLSITIASNQA